MTRLLNILVFLCFALISCENNEEKIRQEIALGSFYYVEVRDIFDLVLVDDDHHKAVLEGKENLLKKVTLRVENCSLIIESDESTFLHRQKNRVRIELYFDTINELKILSPANITSLNPIKSDDLLIWSIGDFSEFDLTFDCKHIHFKTSYSATGNYTFTGNCDDFFPWIYGGTNVFAENMQCQSVQVWHNSIGDVYVHPVKTLNIENYEEGRIFYKGNPQINIQKEIKPVKLQPID